ncbi:hypothetical protein ACSV8I_001920 [Salmonella enterica subsp. enterica serovar Typhi]
MTYINQRNVKAWLKDFPGALNDTGDIPVMSRDLQCITTNCRFAH